MGWAVLVTILSNGPGHVTHHTLQWAGPCYSPYSPMGRAVLLTILSNGPGRVVHGAAVLGVDVDLLGVVGAGLELGGVGQTADLVAGALGDAPDAGVVLLLYGACLDEAVPPSQGAVDGGRGVHCKGTTQQ